jgi:hypothetical protein
MSATEKSHWNKLLTFVLILFVTLNFAGTTPLLGVASANDLDAGFDDPITMTSGKNVLNTLYQSISTGSLSTIVNGNFLKAIWNDESPSLSAASSGNNLDSASFISLDDKLQYEVNDSPLKRGGGMTFL